MKKNCAYFLSLTIMTFVFSRAFSHPVEMQELTFGKFAVSKNDAQYTIVMTPAGVETFHPSIWPFFTGQPGIFQLDNYPPNTEMIPSIPDTTLDPVIPGGPSLDVINFTFSPSPTMTNGAGSVTLNVGATARTSGSGVLYDDGDFSGSYTLTINF